MEIKNNQYLKTGGIQKTPRDKKVINRRKIDTRLGNEFQSILDETLKEVKISAHAKTRIEERNLSLDELDMPKIMKGMDKLEEKGARESLLLYKDMALIVNVRNRTVITAMDFDDDLDVITNIDSAVRIK